MPKMWRDKQIQKNTEKISLPEAEATGSLNQYIYIKLLEDEHELA